MAASKFLAEAESNNVIFVGTLDRNRMVAVKVPAHWPVRVEILFACRRLLFSSRNTWNDMQVSHVRSLTAPDMMQIQPNKSQVEVWSLNLNICFEKLCKTLGHLQFNPIYSYTCLFRYAARVLPSAPELHGGSMLQSLSDSWTFGSKFGSTNPARTLPNSKGFVLGQHGLSPAEAPSGRPDSGPGPGSFLPSEELGAPGG